MTEPNIQQTLERQREVTDFFRTRGDALVTLLTQVRGELSKQLEMIDSVLAVVQEADGQMGIQPQHIEQQLVSVLRDKYPEKTKELTDAEVMALVGTGGMNG